MSLLDGLILDHLLQNVVKTPVYIAIREDLKNDPNALGAGTIADPYDGSKTAGGVYKFDKVMRTIPAHSTIILFPGEYWTQGYKTGTTTGFKVQKGWRIVGSGWAPAGTTLGPTLIRLVPEAAVSNVVFGCGTLSTETVEGFELASLGIDCGFYLLAEAGTTAGAVDVNGSNIRVRDIRVTAFGAAFGRLWR